MHTKPGPRLNITLSQNNYIKDHTPHHRSEAAPEKCFKNISKAKNGKFHKGRLRIAKHKYPLTYYCSTCTWGMCLFYL